MTVRIIIIIIIIITYLLYVAKLQHVLYIGLQLGSLLTAYRLPTGNPTMLSINTRTAIFSWTRHTATNR